MPIIGITFRSVSADIDIDKKYKGDININSVPTIQKIEKQQLGLANLKEALAIEFKFETKYEPKVGSITIEGRVLYQTNKIEEVLGKWKKEKKLEESMIIEVLNAIFRKCLVRAVDLSNELGLPPPIRFPIVKPGKEQKDYIG